MRGDFLAGKDLRLGKARAQPEHHRHHGAADEQGDTPAPILDLGRRQRLQHADADNGGGHDRELLAAHLPARVEGAPVRRCNLRQVDHDAAKLGARREPLQKAAGQHDQRRCNAQRRIGGRARDGEDADRHQGQRQDQAIPPSVAVRVGAESDGADRPRQEPDGVGHQGQHQRDVFVGGREIRLCDIAGVVAVDHEVVDLERIARADLHDRLDGEFSRRVGERRRHGGL